MASQTVSAVFQCHASGSLHALCSGLRTVLEREASAPVKTVRVTKRLYSALTKNLDNELPKPGSEFACVLLDTVQYISRGGGVAKLLDLGLVGCLERWCSSILAGGRCEPIAFALLCTVAVLVECAGQALCSRLYVLLVPLLTCAVKDSLSCRIRVEATRVCNSMLECCGAEFKGHLTSQRPVKEMIMGFGRLLVPAGDFELQVSLVECVFRITSDEQRLALATGWFPPGPLQSFVAIGESEFENDCRVFLNALNSTAGKSRSVYTLACRKAFLGQYELLPPVDYGTADLWVDFNTSSHSVSLYVADPLSGSGASSDDGLWEHIIVRDCNVTSWIVQVLDAEFKVKVELKDPAHTLLPSLPHSPLHTFTVCCRQDPTKFFQLALPGKRGRPSAAAKLSEAIIPIKLNAKLFDMSRDSKLCEISPIDVPEGTPAVGGQINSQDTPTNQPVHRRLPTTSTPKPRRHVATPTPIRQSLTFASSGEKCRATRQSAGVSCKSPNAEGGSNGASEQLRGGKPSRPASKPAIKAAPLRDVTNTTSLVGKPRVYSLSAAPGKKLQPRKKKSAKSTEPDAVPDSLPSQRKRVYVPLPSESFCFDDDNFSKVGRGRTATLTSTRNKQRSRATASPPFPPVCTSPGTSRRSKRASGDHVDVCVPTKKSKLAPAKKQEASKNSSKEATKNSSKAERTTVLLMTASDNRQPIRKPAGNNTSSVAVGKQCTQQLAIDDSISMQKTPANSTIKMSSARQDTSSMVVAKWCTQKLAIDDSISMEKTPANSTIKMKPARKNTSSKAVGKWCTQKLAIDDSISMQKSPANSTIKMKPARKNTSSKAVGKRCTQKLAIDDSISMEKSPANSTIKMKPARKDTSSMAVGNQSAKKLAKDDSTSTEKAPVKTRAIVRKKLTAWSSIPFSEAVIQAPIRELRKQPARRYFESDEEDFVPPKSKKTRLSSGYLSVSQDPSPATPPDTSSDISPYQSPNTVHDASPKVSQAEELADSSPPMDDDDAVCAEDGHGQEVDVTLSSSQCVADVTVTSHFEQVCRKLLSKSQAKQRKPTGARAKKTRSKQQPAIHAPLIAKPACSLGNKPPEVVQPPPAKTVPDLFLTGTYTDRRELLQAMKAKLRAELKFLEGEVEQSQAAERQASTLIRQQLSSFQGRLMAQQAQVERLRGLQHSFQEQFGQLEAGEAGQKTTQQRVLQTEVHAMHKRMLQQAHTDDMERLRQCMRAALLGLPH